MTSPPTKRTICVAETLVQKTLSYPTLPNQISREEVEQDSHRKRDEKP